MFLKKFAILVLTVFILIGIIFYIYKVNNRVSNLGDQPNLEVINTSKSNETNNLKKVDTSSWRSAQVNLPISLNLPSTWHETTDGIYNYDQSTVTGLRDPNFPDNSFKCTFIDARGQNKFYDVISEKIISEDPQIKFMVIRWNANQEPSPTRDRGEEAKIYLVNTPSRSEMMVECTIFKGMMTDEDRIILENILFSIR